MIELERVSATIVTRGDVDVTPSFETIRAAGISDVVIWDNSKHTPNLAVFGRYKAIRYALGDVIYVQDDDCVLPPEAIRQLLAAYEPGKIVANMPAKFRANYDDACLLGFGAVFDRGMPRETWARFLAAEQMIHTIRTPSLAGDWLARYDALFARECDAVFTVMNEKVLVDVEYTDREFASAPDRMWKRPEHYHERQTMIARARAAALVAGRRAEIPI